MFKLVVLFGILAVVAAKPGYLGAGYLGGGHLEAGYGHAPLISIPSAVSYQERTDVFSKPIITTYASHAPVITYSDPVYAYGYHNPLHLKSYGYGDAYHYY
nr:uncharacterized protein LOC111414735 [Onthophagus taurus]